LLASTCSAPHPYIHSFPTRRSSDLVTVPGEQSQHREGCTAAKSRQVPARLEGPPADCALPCGLWCPRQKSPNMRSSSERTFTSRDRKSTRLNSSHQIISYAVFCLKK